MPKSGTRIFAENRYKGEGERESRDEEVWEEESKEGRGRREEVRERRGEEVNKMKMIN